MILVRSKDSEVSMKTRRCGIYSFPKSGNTWMREVIRGLFRANENINDVVPDIYEKGLTGQTLINNRNERWCFYKSHSAKELINYQGTAVTNDLIIYIIRNPLDVFCSQLNYLLKGFSPTRGGMQLGCTSIDEAKNEGLINDFFSAFIVFGTLMPYFHDAGSWMENARFWIEKSNNSDKVIVVKYENMIRQFDESMQPFLFKIGKNQADLRTARELADKRTNDGGKFFWKKKEGTFNEYLTKEQINKFISFHSSILELTDYQDYFNYNKVES